MRNIIDYPLNENDMLTALDSSIDEDTKKECYGGMNGMALHHIKEFLKLHPIELQKYLKSIQL